MSKRSGTGDSLNPTNPNKRTRQPEQTNSNGFPSQTQTNSNKTIQTPSYNQNMAQPGAYISPYPPLHLSFQESLPQPHQRRRTDSANFGEPDPNSALYQGDNQSIRDLLGSSNVGEGLMQAAEGYMIGRIEQNRDELEKGWKKRDEEAQKQTAFLKEQVRDCEKTIRDWQERYAEAMKTITDLADKVDELKKAASKQRRLGGVVMRLM